MVCACIAMRDRKPKADYRVNGDDWEKGAQTLRDLSALGP
jgi:hypothetical protein